MLQLCIWPCAMVCVMDHVTCVALVKVLLLRYFKEKVKGCKINGFISLTVFYSKKRELTPSCWVMPSSVAVAAVAAAERLLVAVAVAVAKQPCCQAPAPVAWTSGALWDLRSSAGTLRLRDGGGDAEGERQREETERRGEGDCFTSYNFRVHQY